MKYINAKYLRENLEEVKDDVTEHGASYIVLYRSEPAFKIIPATNERLSDEKVTDILDSVASSRTKSYSKDASRDKDTLRQRKNKRHDRKRSSETIS